MISVDKKQFKEVSVELQEALLALAACERVHARRRRHHPQLSPVLFESLEEIVGALSLTQSRLHQLILRGG